MQVQCSVNGAKSLQTTRVSGYTPHWQYPFSQNSPGGHDQPTLFGHTVESLTSGSEEHFNDDELSKLAAGDNSWQEATVTTAKSKTELILNTMLAHFWRVAKLSTVVANIDGHALIMQWHCLLLCISGTFSVFFTIAVVLMVWACTSFLSCLFIYHCVNKQFSLSEWIPTQFLSWDRSCIH